MKIKKLKKIRVNSTVFKIKWDKKCTGGSFCFDEKLIIIGTKSGNSGRIFQILCHELLEIVACDNLVRMRRPDCESDYIFVYDHRQHDCIANQFAGLLGQFL